MESRQKGKNKPLSVLWVAVTGACRIHWVVLLDPLFVLYLPAGQHFGLQFPHFAVKVLAHDAVAH